MSYLNWMWSEMNWNELNWIVLNWIELNWMWTSWTECELIELIVNWLNWTQSSNECTTINLRSLWYFTISVTHAQILCMNQGDVLYLTDTLFIYNLGLTEAFIISVHLRHTCAIRIQSLSLCYISLSLIKYNMFHMCIN